MTRIEVRHVVCLGIGRHKVVEPPSDLEAEAASGLPAVGNVPFVLVEAKESDWIVVCFIVRPEVSQQCVGKSIAGSRGITTLVESQVACVTGASILIFAYADNQHTSLEGVLTSTDWQVVT